MRWTAWFLGDEQWARLSPHIIGDERSRGTAGRDNRRFVEAVLRIVRAGSPSGAAVAAPALRDG